MSISRREFLQAMGAVTVASGARLAGGVPPQPEVTRDRFGELLPQRPMGRSGQWLTILGVGGAHFGRLPEAEAQKCLELAIEKGVRFWDNAEMYQNGSAEARYGKLLVPKYREVCFIMTKTFSPDAATARRHLDQSRKRLGVDVIDLWQIHDVKTPEDVDARLENGVLDVVLEAKAKGRVRYVGFTGHQSVAAHLRMLERLKERGVELDTCQMPVNVLDPGYESFIENVLPVLVQRGYAPLAMKTLVHGQLFGKNTAWVASRKLPEEKIPNLVPEVISLADARNFVWAMPVTSAIVGFDSAEQLGENIELARRAVRLDEGRRQKIIDAVAEHAGPEIEFYKRRVES